LKPGALSSYEYDPTEFNNWYSLTADLRKVLEVLAAAHVLPVGDDARRERWRLAGCRRGREGYAAAAFAAVSVSLGALHARSRGRLGTTLPPLLLLLRILPVVVVLLSPSSPRLLSFLNVSVSVGVLLPSLRAAPRRAAFAFAFAAFCFIV
jgi:hypothetical protein